MVELGDWVGKACRGESELIDSPDPKPRHVWPTWGYYYYLPQSWLRILFMTFAIRGEGGRHTCPYPPTIGSEHPLPRFLCLGLGT